MLVWIMPSLILSIVLGSLVGHILNRNTEGAGIYYCPPCGCTGDHIEHKSEGNCDYCNMPLFEVKEVDFDELKEVFALQFRLSSTQASVYSRVIYPTLFGGIFFGVISVFLFRKKSIEIFLALYIIVWSLFGLKYQLYGTAYGMDLDIKNTFAPISFLLFLGPFLYFHSKNLMDDSFRLKRLDFLHFLPGIIVFLYYLVLFLSPDQVRLKHLYTDFDSILSIFEQFIGVVSLVVYLHVSSGLFYELNGSEERKKQEINWLTKFYYATYLLLVVWVSNLLINGVFFEMKSTTINYLSLWITLCIYIYWLGIEILRNEKVLILKNFNANKIKGLQVSEFKERIQKVMETEKPYTDPNLTLNKLAEFLEMKPKELSGSINLSFQKNFYNYINEFRLEEVKRLLLNKDLEHLTILAIAEKAGFKSKSTFNSLFKKKVGITPNEYKKQN